MLENIQEKLDITVFVQYAHKHQNQVSMTIGFQIRGLKNEF